MARVLTQTFCVVGAIIERNGKILLVQESNKYNGIDNGKWNQPAGWLDVGEDPLVAVEREVKEETGFTFTPTAILGIYSLVRQDVSQEYNGTPHPIKIIFIGQTNYSNPQKLYDDIATIKWFTPEEIEAMDISVLRDVDIKKEVNDYFAGQLFPLTMLKHTRQTK